LLQFVQEFNINYLLLYNLYFIHVDLFDIKNHATAQPLTDFIEKAKTQCNIVKVGAVGGKFSSLNRIDTYQTSHSSNPNQQFDVYNIEFEFSNKVLVNPGKYYSTIYLNPNGYACNKDGAFDFYKVQIESLGSLTNIRGVIPEAYIARPTYTAAILTKLDESWSFSTAC